MAVLAQVNCANVTISDAQFCGSLGPEGAACDNILTSSPQSLTLQQWAMRWDDLNNPQVCSVAQTFSDIKGDIEKLCSFGNYCTYSMQVQINSISSKLGKIAKTHTTK